MRCEMPAWAGSSLRDPTPIQNPSAIDRTPVDALGDHPEPVVERLRSESGGWLRPRPTVLRRRLERPETDAVARLVDLDDLDRDGVATADHVFDLVDALAVAELGDVDEAVDALLQLDERAEVGRLDHLAGDDVADLDVLGHRQDALGDGLAGLHVGRGDVDGAVVLDVDLDAELLAETLDGLAALADDEADLVGVDLDREDARRVLRQLGARLGQHGEHLVEDEQPSDRRACSSASRRISNVTLEILMSICRAVMPFFVPATLKSMSPRWSSTPAMSESTT